MSNSVESAKLPPPGTDAGGAVMPLDPDGLPSVPRRKTAAPAVAPSTWAERQGLTAVFSSTRTRLLVIFFALLAIFGAGTTVVIREILEIRLDDRTNEALGQEVQEFQRILNGIDPKTGRRFQSLAPAMELFNDRNVPSVEEAFIFLIGRDIVRERYRSFPVKELPAEARTTFVSFSAGESGGQLSGKFETPIGDAWFRAIRTSIPGTSETGAFVVAILPEGEQRNIRDLQTYGALVTFGAALLVAALAWFLVGRVTAPVQQLTETARSISGGDLSRRIRVRGTSEAAEMAETFNDMLDRLEAVYRSQLEFLRAAGHELRTPLTVATGHLEVMGSVDEEQQATVTLVLDELGRMTRMVEDLHSLAEAEHPDYLAPQPIDMRELAHELIVKASALGERDWQLDAADSGVLVADRDRILQAVLNLADNAVKNTGAGATIAIGVTARGNEVNIWVRDTGVGIEASELDRIFNRFVRGRDAGRRYRGAGLGLAIVETVAEAHGGRVSVESEPGVGSRFAIVLPWRRE